MESNIYEKVTKRILASMVKGEIPWRQTWNIPGRKPAYYNYVTGKPYGLLNSLLLGRPGAYASFKQITDRGGSLKGKKGIQIVYWGEFIPKEHKEEARRLEQEGKDISHLKVRFPKYSTVFNVEDAEGFRMKPEDETREMIAAEDPVDIADMVAKDYSNRGPKVTETDCPPGYAVGEDTVVIPGKKAFEYEEDWYASLFEQMVHSTATPDRCDRRRELEELAQGNRTAREELIAEIGSSMILSAAGLTRHETALQQEAVCKKWIDAMNKDYRLLITSANGAEKAAKLILGKFDASEEEDEE